MRAFRPARVWLTSIALACLWLAGAVAAEPMAPEPVAPTVAPAPVAPAPVAPEPVAPAPVAPLAPPPATPAPGYPETVDYPRFRHSGWGQVQFDDGALGSPSESSPFPSANGIGPFPAANHLFFRRIRPAAALVISPRLQLLTDFNLDLAEPSLRLLDARLDYEISEETRLSVGRFKVPFGWEGLRGALTTNTIERSDMTSGLYAGRDPGLSLAYRKPHLGTFTLGGFLAEPGDDDDSTGQLDLFCRAQLHLDDNLWVGASGQIGTFGLNDSELPVRRLGTELQYQSGPLKVEAEAMWSDGYNSMSKSDTPAAGYYGTVVYRLADPFDLVLSYDRFDPDTGQVNNRKADNATNARDRKVVGLNYYLDREKLQRLMVNYEWKQDLEGAALHTSGFRVRYQIAW